MALLIYRSEANQSLKANARQHQNKFEMPLYCELENFGFYSLFLNLINV